MRLRRIMAGLLMCVMIIGCVLVINPGEAQAWSGGITSDSQTAINNFPDPKLRAEIWKTCAGSDNKLTNDEITATKYLDLSNKGIVNVQGLHLFSGLVTLDLSGNSLDWGSYMSEMNNPGSTWFPNLVNLKFNNITSIGNPCVEYYPNLRHFECTYCTYLDFSNNTLLVKLFKATSPVVVPFNNNDRDVYRRIVGNYELYVAVPSGFTDIAIGRDVDYGFNKDLKGFISSCYKAVTGHSLMNNSKGDVFITAEFYRKAQYTEELILTNYGFSDIEGIEFFPSLKKFVCCNSSYLTSIDFSKISTLTDIKLTNCNQLKSITLGSNPVVNLDLSGTKISSLNVASTPSLRYLDVSNVPTLTSLNVTYNTDLTTLDVATTGITYLNTRNNMYLNELDVRGTQITSLNLSNNPFLRIALLSNTPKLTTIDVRSVPALDYLMVHTEPSGVSVKSYHGTYSGSEATLMIDSSDSITTTHMEHTYDSDSCLAACTVCGHARSTSHFFTSNECIMPCAICGEKRYENHTYDNDQDAQCNICHYIRTLPSNPTVTPAPGGTTTPTLAPGGSTGGSSTTPTTAPSQPTQQPSNPSTPSQSEEGGAAGFVERLYTVALGRPSDPTGKQAWISALRNCSTGGEAAQGFLFSDEFLNKGLSNADFVAVLYRTFFDREPDAAGHAAWVAALERGESKQDVIMGFINSTEWANVCLRYGILSGGTGTPSITIEPNEQIVAFATRLYTTCLKRTPDQGGLMAWARQLANLRDTGTNAAHGFFFSDEMLNNPVSDEEYVTRLYLTFMDRNPDQAGFDAWVGQLKAGVSREEVFQGFAKSPEFGAICTSYGIVR